MGVFEELRNWLAPELKELKAKLEYIEKEVRSGDERLGKEMSSVESRLNLMENMLTQLHNELKNLRESNIKTSERLDEVLRMLIETVRMIAKLEEKIELEKRVERLEEIVLKKK